MLEYLTSEECTGKPGTLSSQLPSKHVHGGGTRGREGEGVNAYIHMHMLVGGVVTLKQLFDSPDQAPDPPHLCWFVVVESGLCVFNTACEEKNRQRSNIRDVLCGESSECAEQFYFYAFLEIWVPTCT